MTVASSQVLDADKGRHGFRQTEARAGVFGFGGRCRREEAPGFVCRESTRFFTEGCGKTRLACGLGNHSTRRRCVRGGRPLRRELGNRPNDRWAGEGKIAPLDADDVHRKEIFEFEILGADGSKRIALFGLAAFGNRFAHFARMCAVEGFYDPFAEAVCLGILDEHFRPCDGLEDAPMPATQME